MSLRVEWRVWSSNCYNGDPSSYAAFPAFCRFEIPARKWRESVRVSVGPGPPNRFSKVIQTSRVYFNSDVVYIVIIITKQLSCLFVVVFSVTDLLIPLQTQGPMFFCFFLFFLSERKLPSDSPLALFSLPSLVPCLVSISWGLAYIPPALARWPSTMKPDLVVSSLFLWSFLFQLLSLRQQVRR